MEDLEARVGIEPTHKGFADLSLTTWVPRLEDGDAKNPRARRGRQILERETGFEPATSTLARSHSTTELLPLAALNYSESLNRRANESEDTPLRGKSSFMGEAPLRVLRGRHNGTIAHVNDAIAIGRRFGIVRNHQYRLSQFLVRLPQHLQDNFGILRIEIAGGFVGQHDGGLIHQRARQRHPLLLAAAQLGRAMLQA